jgi:hypothetical protein
MLTILEYKVLKVMDGEKHIRAVISVNSASELVTEHKNYKFTEASFALELSTGDTYALTNGSWVKQ